MATIEVSSKVGKIRCHGLIRFILKEGVNVCPSYIESNLGFRFRESLREHRVTLRHSSTSTDTGNVIHEFVAEMPDLSPDIVNSYYDYLVEGVSNYAVSMSNYGLQTATVDMLIAYDWQIIDANAERCSREKMYMIRKR